MYTSRAALNRLLDESDISLTLVTLASAATVFGKQIQFKLKAKPATKKAKPPA